MNTFLMWLGGLLISVLAALFVVPHFVDWNGYRGVFEEEASRVFGRDVRVGGSVNVRLLPTPYVNFEKLRISDTSGVTGAPLFQADSFTMWLAVPPLLKGVFEARQVQLDRPVIRLAVDRDGRPNWTDLAVRQGRLPFVPQDVALNSVQITEGEIAYDAYGAGTLARVTGIEGVLSAQGLRGPFSFRGFAQFNERSREVRVASGDVSDDGATKIKAIIQKPDGTTRHALEGDATQLFERPSFKGSLTSVVKLGLERDAPQVDFRAAVEATTASAKLEQIVASFENVGQPQIIIGKAGAAWGERHQVQLDLSSRWLDLDRLSVPFGALEAAEKPEQGRMMPLKVARGLFSRLIGVLPSTTDLQARVAFDQVNLGGEGVSNVNMVLAGSGGPLEMRSLSASLPGGARFDFSGELKPADGGAAFDGTVFVGGPNLVRLLRWAFPDYGRLEQVSDGVFSLSGRMLLGADIVSLDNGIANFSGMPVRGRVKWQDAPNTKLSVQLEGYQLDTRWVGLDQLRLIDLLDQDRIGSRAQAAKEPETATATVQVVGEDGAEAGPAQPGAAVASTEGVRFSGADDVEVSLRAGKLINGPNTLKDFDAVISAKSGKVKITKLAFKTADGLKVSTTGDVAQGQETPSGAFQFTVASDSQRGTGSLTSLLFEQGLLSDRSRDDLALVLDGAAPYRLGGQFSVGKSGAKAIVGTIDGDVQGRQAAGQLRLDGGLEGWRTAPLLVHLNLKTDHAVKSLRQVLDKLGALGPTDGGLETARVAGRGVPGVLIFQAEGITDTGLDWVGDLRADGLDVTWSGTGKASDAGFAMASGNVDVKTARAGDLAALAGWPVGDSVRSTKIAGTFDLTSEGSGVKISSKDMTFGGVSLAGEVALASDGDGTSKTGEAVDPPLKVSGALTASSISLADMMTGLLRETPLVVPAPRVAAGPPSAPGPVSDATPFVSPQPAQLFSDQSFDLKLLKAFSGDLRLNARTLIFEPGLSAKNSELRLRFDGAGAIDVDLTKATSAAGTVSARLKLAQPSGGTGANVDGTLKVSGGQLQNILGRTGGGKPAGRGPFSLNAKFSGRGLTPRDLSLALRGSGTVQFKGARLNGLAPGALADAAEGLLSREPDQSIEGEIAPTLAASLGQGTLKLGSTKVPFRIVDGGVRFAELAIRADGGRVRGVTTIDVLSLNVDSAWSVVAASRFDGKPDWPVVNSVFVGPLKSLHQLRPQISSGAFERELAVQRLERNALRLEELRAEDEARAEEARLRAEELERQSEEEARLAREEAARLAREEAIRRRAREAAEDDAYRFSPPGSQF